MKSEQAAGRLAGQDSGNRSLSNNVVTLKDYGITKMESSRLNRKQGEWIEANIPKEGNPFTATIFVRREWIEANIPREGGKPTETDRLSQPTLSQAGIDYHSASNCMGLKNCYARS